MIQTKLRLKGRSDTKVQQGRLESDLSELVSGKGVTVGRPQRGVGLQASAAGDIWRRRLEQTISLPMNALTLRDSSDDKHSRSSKK